MICSRNEEELRAAAAEIGEGLDSSVEYRVCDMSNRSDTDRLATEALDRFGTIDILTNNAVVNIPQPIDEIEDEIWDRIIEINLTSIMRLTQALVSAMKQQNWGRIVHISSVLGAGSKPARAMPIQQRKLL